MINSSTDKGTATPRESIPETHDISAAEVTALSEKSHLLGSKALSSGLRTLSLKNAITFDVDSVQNNLIRSNGNEDLLGAMRNGRIAYVDDGGRLHQ
jgi:hypothetical protein